MTPSLPLFLLERKHLLSGVCCAIFFAMGYSFLVYYKGAKLTQNQYVLSARNHRKVGPMILRFR